MEGGLKGHFVYRTAFDPANLDHVVAGTMSDGAFTSFDGGRTWQPASGNADAAGVSENIFNVAVSPANPNVVGAQGINMAENDAHAPSEGRHVYRPATAAPPSSPWSTDHRVTLTNGPLMVPHPTDDAVSSSSARPSWATAPTCTATTRAPAK